MIGSSTDNELTLTPINKKKKGGGGNRTTPLPTAMGLRLMGIIILGMYTNHYDLDFEMFCGISTRGCSE